MQNRGQNVPYNLADRNLQSIGIFAQGADSKVPGNGIDRWNNTIQFSINNPTTSPQQVNLFGFTNTLFQLPSAVNPPPSIVQPVLSPVGGGPDDAEFCPSNDCVYTADPISSTVEVVDATTQTVIATIPLIGFSPNCIAYNPVNNQMYVGSSLAAQVVRIDCATNLVVGAPIVIAGPTNAQGMSYNSVKNSMYVCNGAAGAVDEINCITNLTVSSFIPVGAVATAGIAFNPNLNRAYITDPATNFVFVIDCVTNATLFGFATGLVGTRDIVFCSSNSSVYMIGSVSNNARPLNTTTNIFGPIIAVGAATPADICYNPINNLLYVVKSTTNNFVIINPVTNAVVGAVALAMTVSAIAVYNSNDNAVAFLANGAGFGEYQAFNPLFAPQAVVILNGNMTLADIFNDMLGKASILKGLKIITDNFDQFSNNISIQYITITGAVDSLQFQPLNFVSPTNRQSNVIDVRAEFGLEIKPPDTNFIFNVAPLTNLILSLKIDSQNDNTAPFRTDITKKWDAGVEKTNAINNFGNPIADMAMIKKANDILSGKEKTESGYDYNSMIQYAFYPELTGNPIADAAILDAYGFKYDH
jgi:YVTN family beta-propeller protein